MRAYLSTVRAGAVGLTVLMALALFPQFVSAQCDFHAMVPDGRISPTFTINSGTNDMAFFFLGRAGRSYSVEVQRVTREHFDGTLSANWGGVNVNCPVADIAGLRNTGTIEPAPQPNGFGLFRGSFTAPSNAFYMIRVGNTSATSAQVRASISDTTLFNPLWSTFSGFETFYRIQNTTNASCMVTLNLTNDAGALVGGSPRTVTVAANSTFTTLHTGPGAFPPAMAVADNLAGGATFTHDCPPGAIQIDGFLGNFAGTPIVLPIKIVSARE